MTRMVSNLNLLLLVTAIVYAAAALIEIGSGWPHLGMLFAVVALLLVVWVTADETRKDVSELRRLLNLRATVDETRKDVSDLRKSLEPPTVGDGLTIDKMLKAQALLNEMAAEDVDDEHPYDDEVTAAEQEIRDLDEPEPPKEPKPLWMQGMEALENEARTVRNVVGEQMVATVEDHIRVFGDDDPYDDPLGYRQEAAERQILADEERELEVFGSDDPNDPNDPEDDTDKGESRQCPNCDGPGYLMKVGPRDGSYRCFDCQEVWQPDSPTTGRSER